MRPTREIEIDGRLLRIYDGLVAVEDIDRLTNAFLAGAFVCDEVARPDTYAARHWQLTVAGDVARRLPVYGSTIEVLQAFPGCGHCRMQRVYCNCSPTATCRSRTPT